MRVHTFAWRGSGSDVVAVKLSKCVHVIHNVANVTEIYASEETRGTKGAESQSSAVVGMGFLLVQDHHYLPHGQRTSNATDRDV